MGTQKPFVSLTYHLPVKSISLYTLYRYITLIFLICQHGINFQNILIINGIVHIYSINYGICLYIYSLANEYHNYNHIPKTCIYNILSWLTMYVFYVSA